MLVKSPRNIKYDTYLDVNKDAKLRLDLHLYAQLCIDFNK